MTLKKLLFKLEWIKLQKSNTIRKEKFHSGTLENRFGTWNKAVNKAGLKITQKQNLSEIELFENIEKVWVKLGRQPKYDEIKKPLSKYSAKPYEKRYDTW